MYANGLEATSQLVEPEDLNAISLTSDTMTDIPDAKKASHRTLSSSSPKLTPAETARRMALIASRRYTELSLSKSSRQPFCDPSSLMIISQADGHGLAYQA